MTDWVTISSLAIAGGTLVLAVATFQSAQSANRSARIAERSLLEGVRPVLSPSRDADPDEHVRFGDDVVLNVPGHGGAFKLKEEGAVDRPALRRRQRWPADDRPDAARGLASRRRPATQRAALLERRP